MNSRRKLILALSGASAASVWTRPIVDSVMLPAHASTTNSILVFTGTLSGTDTGVTERAFINGKPGPISHTLDVNIGTANEPIVLVCGIIGIFAASNNVTIYTDGIDRTDSNGFTYQSTVAGTVVSGEDCIGGRVYGLPL